MDMIKAILDKVVSVFTIVYNAVKSILGIVKPEPVKTVKRATKSRKTRK